MSSYLLGIDLGTSGVKALLVSTTDPGNSWSQAVDLSLDSPVAGWSEQNPEAWWDGTIQAVRSVLNRSGAEAGAVAGVAVSGQMHGATLLDKRGDVLRPAILWNDQRSADECEHINGVVGRENLASWVGNPALAGFTAPKLLWVRRHEPEVFARLATVLLPKDYINYRLTGQLATDPSDASGTLLYDVLRDQWSTEMMSALDLRLGLFPPVSPSTACIGSVTPEVSSSTGLRAGTPVVAGGADNACAAVGAGIVSPRNVLVSLGTSGTVVAPIDQPVVDPQLRLHMFRHAVPDTCYLMGVVLSAGASLHWLRDVMADSLPKRPGVSTYDVMTQLAAQAPPGSDNLLFLPYLTGERTPHGDPSARGAFVGISRQHGMGHIIRSVLEGVCFALGDSVSLMRQLEVELDNVRITGGGARSPVWRQILANVMNCRLTTVGNEIGPALGAAILAGVGAGVFESVHQGVEALVCPGVTVMPDPEVANVYAHHQRRYDELYPLLKETFRAMVGED